MKRPAVLTTAMLLIGATPAPVMTDRDFEQLMRAAVEASSTPSEVQPTTKTVCVKRELEPPLSFEPPTAVAKGAAVIPRQSVMPRLPTRFIVYASNAIPTLCVIDHAPPFRGLRADVSRVALTFTRPVLVNGQAYINEYEDCPGLCGTTFLRVFKKQNGKWTQVERMVLSVS